MTACHQNSPLREYEYPYVSEYAMNDLSNEDFAELVIKYLFIIRETKFRNFFLSSKCRVRKVEI